MSATVDRYLVFVGAEESEASAPRRGRTRQGRVLRTGRETKRILRKYVVPAIGSAAMRDVTRRQVVDLLNTVAQRNGGVMANRVLTQVKRLFAWAVGQGVIDDSPCTYVERPAKEKSRDRTLSDNELSEIWNACDQLGYPWGHLYKFMLLTGTRRAEAAGARRDEIADGVWTIPAARQKSDINHDIPLSSMADSIVADIANTGPWLFTFNGVSPLTSFSTGKERIDKVIDETRRTNGQPAMPEWTPHDFRRTMRSHMAQMRVSSDVAEACLGHTKKGIVAVYNRYDMLEEKKAALEAWARRVESIINPRPPANVVLLRKTQQL